MKPPRANLYASVASIEFIERKARTCTIAKELIMKSKKQKILLTGATGKLGSFVCRKLHEEKFEVIATDQNMKKDLPVKVKVADLRDRFPCYELLDGVDAVVHLAGHPNDSHPVKQLLLSDNVSITMNLLHAACECGVTKFLAASSVQAMSHNRRIHEDESIPPSNLDYLPADGHYPAKPGNVYALSKYLIEEMLKFYANEHSFSCVAFRFPFLFNPEYLKYYKRYRSSFKHYSNLDECFTSLTMDDAASLIVATLKSDLPGYRCYFPACPEPLAEEKVGELIEKYYQGVKLNRPKNKLKSLVDISQITKETGWIPKDNVMKIINDSRK